LIASRETIPKSKFKTTILALVVATLLWCSNLQASEPTSLREIITAHSLMWPIVVVGVAMIAVLMAWLSRSPPAEPVKAVEKQWLSNEQLTDRFIAAIPQITTQLNLEIATAQQTEVFEAREGKMIFGDLIDLGENVAQIHVPVTYRYHLPLRSSCRLELRGNVLVVHAPKIEASLPPAIHTQQMEKIAVRGWGRLPPTDLMERLERQMTPTLTAYATDDRHLELVRNKCRKAVAQFVMLWLKGEQLPRKVTAMQIRFADEPHTTSSLKLLSDFE